MAESFFATLECELIARRNWKSKAEAKTAVFTWIEGWYNPRRRHSALDHQSPMKFRGATQTAKTRRTTAAPETRVAHRAGRVAPSADRRRGQPCGGAHQRLRIKSLTVRGNGVSPPPAPALLWIGIATVLVAHFGHAGFKLATDRLVAKRTRQRNPVPHKRLHHALGRRLVQDVALRALQMLLTASLMMGFILLVQHNFHVGTLPLVDLAIMALAAEWLHVTEWFFGFFESDEDTTVDARHAGH